MTRLTALLRNFYKYISRKKPFPYYFGITTADLEKLGFHKECNCLHHGICKVYNAVYEKTDEKYLYQIGCDIEKIDVTVFPSKYTKELREKCLVRNATLKVVRLQDMVYISCRLYTTYKPFKDFEVDYNTACKVSIDTLNKMYGENI